MTRTRHRFFAAVDQTLGPVDKITRQQIIDVCKLHGIAHPAWLTNEPAYRLGRGVYSIVFAKSDRASTIQGSVISSAVHTIPVTEIEPVAHTSPADTQVAMAPATVIPISPNVQTDTQNLVPSKVLGYVPFGNFTDVRKIVGSARFYPIYITGLSGNGKTMMVEQACAIEKRECVRVNVTIETDEDDLLGGFRLVDGHTVWHNGPVVKAMEQGAVLLLDEVDLGSNKLMCLQPVLEGKPIFLKKINKLITPAKGFNIIATANTKGKGSDDGRFVGTNVMNEAFLERFSITMEQEYPNTKTEAKILNNVLGASDIQNDKFVQRLVSWADIIRKSFAEGAVSEIISTRRLVHICEAFVIFGKEPKALELCLNRFDVDTKRSFMELYDKLDDTPAQAAETSASTVIDSGAEVSF